MIIRIARESLLLVIGILALGCSTDSDVAGELPTRSIGIQVSPAMTLAMVAKDAGFFEQNGVNVELEEFTAGKFALQAFLSGGIDYAISGEVPVALATIQGNDIRVVSQVVERTTNEVRVVALRDESSDSPRSYFDARQRSVATSFGGGPEFFTYSFFRNLGIDEGKIRLLSQKPEDMPAALAARSVDAIAIFDPFAFIAERQLGERAVTFADEDLYSELYVLDAKPEQLETDAEVIESILRGLADASEFIATNPDDAKRIMQRYTKLDSEVVEGIWDNFVFKPALTRRLVDYWNAQYDWAIATDKARKGTARPDFDSIIDDSFLRRVDPALVQR